MNLQYGDVTQDLLHAASNSSKKIIQVERLDLYNDLDDLSSLIAACDGVISIDNATAHLAGALGIDTRILLPFAADERWGLGSNSYWNDSVTLYRQERPGDWGSPLQALSRDIAILCKTV